MWWILLAALVKTIAVAVIAATMEIGGSVTLFLPACDPSPLGGEHDLLVTAFIVPLKELEGKSTVDVLNLAAIPMRKHHGECSWIDHSDLCPLWPWPQLLSRSAADLMPAFYTGLAVASACPNSKAGMLYKSRPTSHLASSPLWLLGNILPGSLQQLMLLLAWQ